MRMILRFLRQQFIVPVLQLTGDGVDVGGLLNCLCLEARAVVCAKSRFRRLNRCLSGSGVQLFPELLEDSDGRLDLSWGWCLHIQMRMPQEGFRANTRRVLGCLLSICSVNLTTSGAIGCAQGFVKPSLAAASSAAIFVGASTVVRRGSPTEWAYSRSVW